MGEVGRNHSSRMEEEWSALDRGEEMLGVRIAVVVVVAVDGAGVTVWGEWVEWQMLGLQTGECNVHHDIIINALLGGSGDLANLPSVCIMSFVWVVVER